MAGDHKVKTELITRDVGNLFIILSVCRMSRGTENSST